MKRARPALRRMAQAALVCLVLAGCGKSQAPEEGGVDKILLIVVDTLRADALGCYGYERPTSPAMDELAQSGVLFLQARAQSPWTLPSLATILTGLYPRQHGALRSEREFYALPQDAVSVAETLQSRGYSTAAYVNTQFGFEPYQLDQGFETYSVAKGTKSSHIRDASTTVDLARNWLREHAQERFFLFVHLFDPHLKYEAPEAFRKSFVRDPGYSGEFTETWGEFDDLQNLRTGRSRAGRSRARRHDKIHLRDLYDAEIAYTDFAIGNLIDALDSHGIRDETLLILTADHGEEFWDHDGFEHGHSFYDEVIRIPLMISWPARLPAGATDVSSVGQIDIVPTILDAAGMEIPGDLPGSSLLGIPANDWDNRIQIAEAPLSGPGLAGFVWRKNKLLLFAGGNFVLTKPWEDPRETRDRAAESGGLIGQYRANIARLEKELRRAIVPRSRIEQDPIDLDEEHRETLRHQGYLR